MLSAHAALPGALFRGPVNNRQCSKEPEPNSTPQKGCKGEVRTAACTDCWPVPDAVLSAVCINSLNVYNNPLDSLSQLYRWENHRREAHLRKFQQSGLHSSSSTSQAGARRRERVPRLLETWLPVWVCHLAAGGPQRSQSLITVPHQNDNPSCVTHTLAMRVKETGVSRNGKHTRRVCTWERAAAENADGIRRATCHAPGPARTSHALTDPARAPMQSGWRWSGRFSMVWPAPLTDSSSDKDVTLPP